jgi:FkbM family methyltransferase
MVVVDIGANIGFYSLLAASRIGEKGRVLAFEPGSDNCTLLKMSLAANNFHNVTLHNVAVADLDGVVGFVLGGSNGSINRDNPNALPFQVPAVKLDTLLRDEPRIDLVKMDIEGAEGLALAGMQQLLTRHRPIIFTEFSPNALQVRSGLTPEEFLNRLRDIGYDLHVLHRIGGQNVTPQSNEEIMVDFTNYQSDHLDLVAYPR